MRLFETNENEAIDSATPRNNESKMPHCKIYNPMMELTSGPADDAKCHGTPRGGCVVGRCWEACPSWAPVSLFVSLHGSLARLEGCALIP